MNIQHLQSSQLRRRPAAALVHALMGRFGSICMSICMSTMCALMVLTVSVSSTVAQAQEELRPPKTTDEPSSPKYLIMIVAVLLVAGVVFAASLKSKRTHQD